MKSISRRIVLSSIIVAALYAHPLLVTVEIGDQPALRLWQSLDIPTYDFIKGFALAEIDSDQLSSLLAHGFEVRIIDETPWDNQYVVVEVSSSGGELFDKCIWQDENIALLEIAEEQIYDLYSHRRQFRPVRRVPLSARFWQHMLAKYVPLRSIQWDPFIQSLVDQVNTDSLTSYIQRLQDFVTRYKLTDSSYAASEWLLQKFNSFGYAAFFDSFYIDSASYLPDTGYERNVLAEIAGATSPNEKYIICGHFDSILWDTVLAHAIAPGADDNASGVAAVLEAARILRTHSWDPTMVFACWAAEEFGWDYGSLHYAQRADSLGIDISGVINMDMIGFMNNSQFDCNVSHHDFAPFAQWLSDVFYHAAQTYAPLLIVYREIDQSARSDHYFFAIHGYPAVCGSERWSWQNPHYHDTSDVLSYMTPALYTEIAKTAIAAFASLALCPGYVQNVAVRDVGDSSSLEITWTANTEPDVTGYRIYWGLQSEVYTDSLYLLGAGIAIDTLTDLMTDSTYYITVRAVNVENHVSLVATEVTGVPRLVPLAPSGVIAMPVLSGVKIDWQPNDELDFAGYRLYRRINDNPVYDSLNATLLADTTYTDYPLSGANRYYYAVRAFDQSGYYSGLSAEAYGRPITLDQGVLVVDETRNGTNPPDSLQDAFYAYILDNYFTDVYEYDSSQHAPILADFVPYSSIVWFADDYIENFASDHVNGLQTYLDLGGNIWFAGWRPTANLEGQTTYPFSFGSGDFMSDYFQVSNVAITAVTDSFQGADGLLSYPRLDVDPLKVPFTTWNGVLRYIEAVTPASGGETIYTMDMRNATSPHQGSPCAVRYLGNDFKTVFFGFPIYFMDQDDARLAALKVMDDFGEVGIAEMPKTIAANAGILLQQNMPNPFTDQTVLSYQIIKAGNVRLKVYNIAGQLVKTLVNGGQAPGVYNIVWSGLDDQGRQVSSGVYFCRLETDDQSAIKKMTILR